MNWKFPYYDINTGIDWKSIDSRFDWFRDMESVPQDAIWHAEGNVQIHTKMVCEALINLPEYKELDEQERHIVFTSALFHDIEKRSTTTEEELNGRICVTAPKHAQKGEYTTRRVLYRDIPTPFYIREVIAKLVRYHGVPLWNDDALERVVVETSLFVPNKLLAMLSKADVLGRICSDSAELLEKIEYYKMTAEDLDCFDKPKEFVSELARYHFLAKKTFIDYVPFDETKFTVNMLSGIPGSGKDTYISKFLTGEVISLDDIRRELKIKPTDSKGNGRVIQEAIERCKVLMRKKVDFTFNATNITKELRAKWINLFEEYKGKIVIHYIEVPYSTLLKQNSNREYGVPTDKVESLIDKLEMPTVKECTKVVYHTN